MKRCFVALSATLALSAAGGLALGGCSDDDTAACGPCAPTCGDGSCDANESCRSCPADCGSCAAGCGDGVCAAGEDWQTCPTDCGHPPGGG